MARHNFTTEDGRTFGCEIPELTVREGRERLRQIRTRTATQLRLQARVQLIDKHYEEATQADYPDLQTGLAKIDDLASQSELATEELANFVDSFVSLQFFCDGVDGYADMADLRPDDVRYLTNRCRQIVLGDEDGAPLGEGS